VEKGLGAPTHDFVFKNEKNIFEMQLVLQFRYETVKNVPGLEEDLRDEPPFTPPILPISSGYRKEESLGIP
jgi:hypothetical protein